MATLVWSDTHFNHAGILRYCAATRPYASVEEMNAGLINRWNSTVRPTDDIFLLGDFAFNARGLGELFAQLAGHKHLVIGNHDQKNPHVLKLPWQSQHHVVTLRENGVRAIACHYPLETWEGAHRGYLHLHGHSHGTLKRRIAHRFDVGVDVEANPIQLASYAAIASMQVFEPADHHGDL